MVRVQSWTLMALLFASLVGGCTRSTVSTGPSSPPTSAPAVLPPVVSSPPVTTTPAAKPGPATRPVSEPTVTETWKPAVATRDWKYIVLHHTATESGSVESIHEAHLQNKDKNGKPWLGIGYHFVIGNGNGMPDGEIEPTFRWRQQMHGAHAGAENPQYNQKGIGICMVGNFENTPPTPAQMQSVKTLVHTLRDQYRIPATDIVGHRDIKSTECPGKLFPMTAVTADHWPTPGGRLSSDTAVPQVADQGGKVLR